MNTVPPKVLAGFTRTSLCLPHLRGRDAATVMFEVCRAFEVDGAFPAPIALFNVALNHYYLTPDNQCGDVAYSIGCLPSLESTLLAAGNTEDGCCWRPNTEPVHVVFLIATAPRDAAICAALVHAIRQAAADCAVLRGLHSASTPASLLAALATIPVLGTVPADIPARPRAEVAGISR